MIAPEGQRHLPRMTDQTEPGHIRAAVDIELQHPFARQAIQREHRLDGRPHIAVRRQAPLQRRGDHSRSQPLGEHQRVSGHGAGIRLHALWVDGPGHGVAELDLVIGDAVPA